MVIKEVFVTATWAFLKEIARLNKKAARIGVSSIAVEDLGKVTKTRTEVARLEGESDVRTFPLDVQHYRLTLPEPAECPWEPIVKITPTDEGTSFAEPMPAGTTADALAWKGVDARKCDHCHANRVRNISYVVRNKSDGKVLQLGRNCFQDYVGKDTLAALEFQSVIMINLGGDDDGFWFGGAGLRTTLTESVRKIVAISQLLYSKAGGWFRTEKNELNGRIEVEGTHRVAGAIVRDRGLIGDNPHAGADIFKGLSRYHDLVKTLTDADLNAADEVIARMREIEVSDEFGETLKNLAEYDFVPEQKASLAAYIPQFLRQIERKTQEAVLNAKRVYRGTVGQREVFEKLTCVRCPSFETDYGVVYVNTFEDADHNVLVWKTGSQSFPEGETVTLKGTVKDHSEYRGTKQTILSRCKVEK